MPYWSGNDTNTLKNYKQCWFFFFFKKQNFAQSGFGTTHTSSSHWSTRKGSNSWLENILWCLMSFQPFSIHILFKFNYVVFSLLNRLYITNGADSLITVFYTREMTAVIFLPICIEGPAEVIYHVYEYSTVPVISEMSCFWWLTQGTTRFCRNEGRDMMTQTEPNNSHIPNGNEMTLQD